MVTTATTTPMTATTAAAAAATKKNARKVSRVGAEFQCVVPLWNDAKQSGAAAASSSSSSPSPMSLVKQRSTNNNSNEAEEDDAVIKGGTVLWQASRHTNAAELDAYLDFIRNLFYYSKDHYDEERSLYFLKQCGYDIAAAKKLIQPMRDVPLDTQEDKQYLEAVATSEDNCFVCGDGGDLLLCDFAGCPKVYHQACTKLDVIPEEDWYCRRHFCHAPHCEKPVLDVNMQCVDCPRAFCNQHVPQSSIVETQQHQLDLQASATAVKFVEFRCPKCLAQFSTSDSSRDERRLFMRMLLAIANGKVVRNQRGVGIDVMAVYPAVKRHGGLQKILHNGEWKKIRRIFRFPKALNALDDDMT
jgi:hypothetical protein